MRREAQLLIATIERLTGRRYPQFAELIASAQDARALHDFARLARDLEDAVRRARREGNRDAWMHGRFTR